MTTLKDIKETLKINKDRLTSKYGLSIIAIFGSYGRGQQTPGSDVDILVDFKKPIGIEFIDLADELENLLKTKVDLVSKNGVRPDYFKQIERELYYVWPGLKTSSSDILGSIEKIKAYTANKTFDTFLVDSKTIDAVIWNFKIIGEAANRLPEDFKDSHAEINWFRIRGFRNRIVHDYMGIDYKIVWTIIEKDINQLAIDMATILERMWKHIT